MPWVHNNMNIWCTCAIIEQVWMRIDTGSIRQNIKGPISSKGSHQTQCVLDWLLISRVLLKLQDYSVFWLCFLLCSLFIALYFHSLFRWSSRKSCLQFHLGRDKAPEQRQWWNKPWIVVGGYSSRTVISLPVGCPHWKDSLSRLMQTRYIPIMHALIQSMIHLFL